MTCITLDFPEPSKFQKPQESQKSKEPPKSQEPSILNEQRWSYTHLVTSKKPQPLKYGKEPESFRTLSEVRFDRRGLKYHMSDYGITVIIPENAVDGDALLRIGVYYIDSFQFPEDHRLVSDVFWIDSNVPLQRAVELYVPHFAKIENKNNACKLHFFLSSDMSYLSSGVMKFLQAPRNSYSFATKAHNGRLILNHFCSGCIMKKVTEDALPLQYLITRVLPKDCETNLTWAVDFVFTYALPSCQKVSDIKGFFLF